MIYFTKHVYFRCNQRNKRKINYVLNSHYVHEVIIIFYYVVIFTQISDVEKSVLN